MKPCTVKIDGRTITGPFPTPLVDALLLVDTRQERLAIIEAMHGLHRRLCAGAGVDSGLPDVAVEREACAKVCEEGINNAADWDGSYWDQACENRASAIRARGTS